MTFFYASWWVCAEWSKDGPRAGVGIRLGLDLKKLAERAASWRVADTFGAREWAFWIASEEILK
ncbi:unnamed protein product [Linum tenue]|uniref:Uncharacterized protein n=1 Tax=Linum tenue TaxID=586396 RepID=A0AAV0LCK6_9ROSI|nr:unnamed protein product [Linum tenue]